MHLKIGFFCHWRGGGEQVRLDPAFADPNGKKTSLGLSGLGRSPAKRAPRHKARCGTPISRRPAPQAPGQIHRQRQKNRARSAETRAARRQPCN
jgi:hypothetical protein